MRRQSLLVIAILSAIASPALAAKKAPAAPAPPTSAPIAVTSEHLRSLSWRSVGPANMGGRVSEIALVPGKPNQYFVATGTGGLFKTANGGITYSPVYDDQPVVSLGAIAVAPSDTKLVYAGGGEGNGRNSSTWGNGMYKSTDGGDSFNHLPGLDATRDIPRLAVDPRNANVVYAAAMGHLWDANPERGLYKTSDGGLSWRPILQVDENTGCIDVVLDPANPDTIYAAMYARRRQAWSFVSGGFGWKGGLFKSTDAGATWTRLGEGLPAQTGRVGLAVWARDPSHVYAVIEADDRGTVSIDNLLSKAGGVFKSSDGGAHWTRLSALTPRSFYFSKIVVDPADENRLYVLGYGLYLSDDNGATFRANGAVLPHGDMHSLVVDPADTDHLLMGTDGGVYESRDKAKTWRYIDNVPLGQFYEIGLGMDSPYTICGGLQDNGTWCGPSQGRAVFGESAEKQLNISNQDWFFVWDGDGYYVQIDPRDASRIYAEWQEGNIGRVDRRTGRVKYLKPVPREGEPAYRFNWNSPFLISRHDPDTLYMGGNHVFRLTAKGEAWVGISPDLSGRDVDKVTTTGSGAETHGTVVALAESPLAKGLLWAGTDDGKLWLTRDDGANWEELSAKLEKRVPRGTYVSRLEASHAVNGRVYASLDGHRTGDNRPYLLVSDDFGASWRSLGDGLPEGAPVKVVREDPVNPDLLFAGTEFGALVSLDRGGHWLPLRPKGFPAVMAHDLQIHPRDRDLVMGTHGRSIYVLDDLTGLEQLTPELTARPVVLLKPRPATGFYLMPRGGHWGHDRFAAKNAPAGASLNYWVKERDPDGAKLVVSDAHGQMVRELKGAAEAGLNRVNWDLTREKEQRVEPEESEWSGQTPFVPAGEYEVVLTVGKEKSTAKVSVSYAEGVGPEPVSQLGP